MKHIILISVLIFSFLNLRAMEISVRPGELPNKLTVVHSQKESHFIIKGEANVSDLIALKTLPENIKSLDLSKLIVKGEELGEGSYCGVMSWRDGELPDYMLMGTAVEEVNIPDGTTVIGAGVFAKTPLKKFNAKNVEKVGAAAFYGCGSLESVDFSKSELQEIPERCFSATPRLTSAIFPASLEKVGVRAFYESGIKSIYLPGANDIGDYAFALCPDFGEMTFASGCKLGEGVFFNDSSLDISNQYFSSSPALLATNTSLAGKELLLSGPVIKEGAYAGTDVIGLKLADDVARIDKHAFRNTTYLQTVNVVSLKSTIPSADEDAFSGVDVTTVHLVVEKEFADLWRNAPVWKNFIIEGVATGIEQIADSQDSIHVSRSGDILTVTADEPVREASLYSLSGLVLASVQGENYTLDLRIPDEAESVMILRVSTGKAVKVIKLTDAGK